MGHTGFMVNEYEATASYPLMIFLNVDKNEYPVKKQGVFIERAIEAACALCLRAAQEKQELGIIFYTSSGEGGISVIAPSAFTQVPILERLAALNWTATANVTAAEHTSARAMLEQGKHLSYGTRFLYTGPDLGDEAYISLNSLRKYHLSLEYLIIDERAMPALVPGNSRRYKMKEEGREIV
jgi:predicted RecB family nuclease